MYLLVFTTLMIGIIGLYTQVLALQTARLAAHQSAVGSAMLQWHSAAVSMAASIIRTNPAAYNAVKLNGCSLTYVMEPGTVAGGFTPCPAPILAGGAVDAFGTVTTGPGAPANPNLIPNQAGTKNECVHLVSQCTVLGAFGCSACTSSYDTLNYQFYSILYQDAGTNQNRVVTFVPAPKITAANPPPGYLSLVHVPGGTGNLLGQTASDLLQQLNMAGAPNYTYGSFKGFPAAPSPQLVVAGGTYNLPSTGGFKNLCMQPGATCLANGSVAVVGSPDGF